LNRCAEGRRSGALLFIYIAAGAARRWIFSKRGSLSTLANQLLPSCSAIYKTNDVAKERIYEGKNCIITYNHRRSFSRRFNPAWAEFAGYTGRWHLVTRFNRAGINGYAWFEQSWVDEQPRNQYDAWSNDKAGHWYLNDGNN
jgi:hypothetical protein